VSAVSRSALVAATTSVSVGTAVLLSVAWFATAPGLSRLEPAVQTLGLLGGITGLLAERRAALRARRGLALATLAEEFRATSSVLTDPRFTPGPEPGRPRVYPRIPVSAVDAALTSGALDDRADAEAVRRLHGWRDAVTGFNRRLDLTEVRTFTTGTPAEIGQFERAICHRDGYLAEVRRQFSGLQEFFAADYPAMARPQPARPGCTRRPAAVRLGARRGLRGGRPAPLGSRSPAGFRLPAAPARSFRPWSASPVARYVRSRSRISTQRSR
jgi:hypothetical protein